MIVFFINISHFQLAGSPVRSGPWYQIKSMKRKVINWEKFLDNFFEIFMGLSLSNIHSIFTLDFRKIELMRWFDFTICVYIFLLLSFLLSQIVGLLMKNIFCWYVFGIVSKSKLIDINFFNHVLTQMTSQHYAMPSTQRPIHLWWCTSHRCYEKWTRGIVSGSHLSHCRFHPPIRMIYHRDKRIYAHNTLPDSA